MRTVIYFTILTMYQFNYRRQLHITFCNNRLQEPKQNQLWTVMAT